MSPDEFFDLAGELVGDERGKVVRIARLLDVSYAHLAHVHSGSRPLPEEYARRILAVRDRADDAGRWVSYLSPRLERVVEAAKRAGAAERPAVAAVAAWAALRLTGRP